MIDSKGIFIFLVIPFFGSSVALTKKNIGSRYEITEERLKEVRSHLMYWYSDKGGNSGTGDYQSDIHSSVSQLNKNFAFELPFYGIRYNYTRVSINGYLEFTDPPESYKKYPLTFPRNWPKENDPSFIGPFYTKARIGAIRSGEIDQRKPGVYYRVESNLTERSDQFGVELRERVQLDIREGSVIGSKTFKPKHVIITTWKNVSFHGGIDASLFNTNTFQLVLATDEIATYAIFNYLDINWTTHTEAGGDTTHGEGGVPAYVGFNAGRGTRAFEYNPFSQHHNIRDLAAKGCANGFKGRHIFRVDNKVMPGTCSNDMDYVCHLYLDQN